MILSGWGCYPKLACQLHSPRDEADLRALIAGSALIARGNGRSYGDSAMNPAGTVSMRHFNRMIAFDQDSGQLIAEAGVMLGDIITAFLPRGWFPSVTPGTKFVTLGGMIAADVHGKNHHKHGSFGAFVDWIEVMDATGTIRRCDRTTDSDLFHWTLGGMGLTGIILRAAIRLTRVSSAWINQTTIATANLTETMERFEETLDATYSVAWIDCLSSGDDLGRSVVMLGEHAAVDQLPVQSRADPLNIPQRRRANVPFNLPRFVLSQRSMRAFNALYYRMGQRNAGSGLVNWNNYFYPLDRILNWNRIYGRRGMVQFQCALPLATSRAGLQSLLENIAEAGLGSFLAVLKRFGPQSSPFSFPMEGYTLALDFPVSAKSLALLDRLDDITIAHGGRFYLAKDGRLSSERLAQSDPRVADFAAMRAATGAANAFASHQSERLHL